MFIGTLTVDLLLGDVHSLKQKRSIVKPLLRDIKRTFDLAAAEVGHHDLHRRVELGLAVVAGDAGHCQEVLAAAERAVVERPEVEVLSTKQRLFNEEDV